MAYVSKRTGQEIDNLLDKVASGEGGGSAENGIDDAFVVDQYKEDFTIKVDEDSNGRRVLKLNLTQNVEQTPSEFQVP